MIRELRLAAAFAFGAGLMAAGAAPAQTQASSAAQPVAAAQPAPPAQPAPWAQSAAPTIKPWGMDTSQPAYSVDRTSQPTYSVDPPPEGSSGIYLPAVVLGYAKSAAGCVVIGCEDGPQAGGASGPSSAASDQPPPVNPGPSEPR